MLLILFTASFSVGLMANSIVVATNITKRGIYRLYLPTIYLWKSHICFQELWFVIFEDEQVLDRIKEKIKINRTEVVKNDSLPNSLSSNLDSWTFLGYKDKKLLNSLCLYWVKASFWRVSSIFSLFKVLSCSFTNL